MFIKSALIHCISFLASPAWTKSCSGKLIANYICLPKDYSNRASQSFPNPVEVIVYLNQVILLDINPKKNKISLDVDFLMVWFDNRLELQDYNISDRFGLDDAENLWVPNYRIKRYLYFPNISIYLALITRVYFIYSRINLRVYPILGIGEEVFWVDRDNATDNTAIFLYSEFRADIFCKMELEAFPFDKQTCLFEVLT